MTKRTKVGMLIFKGSLIIRILLRKYGGKVMGILVSKNHFIVTRAHLRKYDDKMHKHTDVSLKEYFYSKKSSFRKI